MASENQRVAELEEHLHQIEREVRAARGEKVDSTPWDYQIPSGSDLRHLRETCELSRAEVADILDYSEGVVGQYETGHKPPGRAFIQSALLLYKREWPR